MKEGKRRERERRDVIYKVYGERERERAGKEATERASELVVRVCLDDDDDGKKKKGEKKI